MVIIHGVSGTINSQCKISHHMGLNVNSSQCLLLFRGSGLIIRNDNIQCRTDDFNFHNPFHTGFKKIHSKGV